MTAQFFRNKSTMDKIIDVMLVGVWAYQGWILYMFSDVWAFYGVWLSVLFVLMWLGLGGLLIREFQAWKKVDNATDS